MLLGVTARGLVAESPVIGMVFIGDGKCFADEVLCELIKRAGILSVVPSVLICLGFAGHRASSFLWIAHQRGQFPAVISQGQLLPKSRTDGIGGAFLKPSVQWDTQPESDSVCPCEFFGEHDL